MLGNEAELLTENPSWWFDGAFWKGVFPEMVFIFNRIFWILNDLPGCSYKVTLPSKRPGREAFLMHMEQQRRMKLGPEAPPMEEGGAGQLHKHQTPEV